MKKQQHSHFRAIAAASALLLGLTACGGGGGGDTAPTTPTATITTFSGTAATGAALANATVSITCAAGSGSTATSATGTYSKDIASVTLPCALRAASADGTTVLYSVTSATATSATTQVANITPLTQLVVASLTGTEPATFFNNFNAATAAVVTPASVAAAQTAVLNTLTQAGIDTAGVTDLISGALTAGSRTGYDGVLDAVQTQLAATGTTLATLTTTVAATSPVATAPGVVIADHTPRLPASMLLNAKASNCAALRSGNYVAINPRRGVTLAEQTGVVSFDAKTLTFSDNSVADGGGTLAVDGTCAYVIGNDAYVVSRAGILMGTDTVAGQKGMSILIPRQTFTVSDLQGSWNAIGLEKNAAGTSYVGTTISADIAATGAVTNLNQCTSATSCSVSTTTINLTSHADGGFNFVGSGTSTYTQRAFGYRSGSGDLMLVTIGGGGSFNIWTKKRTLSLPEIGTAYSQSWFLRVSDQLVAGNIDIGFASSVSSVDAAAKTVTRTSQTSTGAPDYVDWVTFNSPRDGFNRRVAMSVTATDGRTVNLRERTSMGMAGMGLSVQTIPAINTFQMSVDQ